MMTGSDGDRDEDPPPVESSDERSTGLAQDEKREDGNVGNGGGARPTILHRPLTLTRRSSQRYHHMRSVGELETYPPDSYSFMATHSPFVEPGFFAFGLMVFSFQISFLLCMLLSLVDPTFIEGEVDNPTDSLLPLPSNVNSLARGTQFLAVMIYSIFCNTSLRDCVTAIELLPRLDRVREGDKYGSAIFACVLRFFQGGLATFVTLLLILNTADVVEIVLNFAAVGFISELDEAAFELAKWGKYGQRLEEEAKRIETQQIPYCVFLKYRHKRHNCVVIPITLAMLIMWISVVYYQKSKDHWLTAKFRVQFRDQALHPYSGCYDLDPDINHKHRHNYNGGNTAQGVFGYCGEDHHWVLFTNNDNGTNEGGINNDPCEVSSDNQRVYSADTNTFDIWSSFDELWFTASGEPLDLYFMEEGEDLNCKSFMYDGVCDIAFNEKSHEYDGGDCCATTCSKTNCGSGGVTGAFEVEGMEGNGYPHCNDLAAGFLVTILLTGARSSRTKGVFNVTDAQVEDYLREKGIDFWQEPPSPAYFTVDCGKDEDEDKVNILSVPVNGSMTDKKEIIRVPDGTRCQVSVTNTTNLINEWDNVPIWFVNYTVYHTTHTDKKGSAMVSGESSKEQSVSFRRIPDCYFDKLKIEFSTAYASNDSRTKALRWLVDDKSGNSMCDDKFLIERFALSTLNFAANVNQIADAPWMWISTQEQCGWKNIACDNGNVTTLVVSRMNLSGTIAPDIGFLTGLQLMDYDNNDLFGTIPSDIGLLTNLKFLDIDNNRLHGAIPTEFGNLVNLRELDLDSNQLSGTIPTELGKMINVRELDLKYNKLSGTIPTEIGNFPNMTTLWLTNNTMTGSVPTQLGKLTKLKYFLLDNNNFTGSIPTEIGLMTSLSWIDLRGNSLTGSVPTEIGLMTNLTEIRLEGNDFTGIIPVEVASLGDLEILTFDDSLTGDIPGNVKTLVPCILCSGNSYELTNRSNNNALSDNGPDVDTCRTLLVKQQDTKKPVSVNDCETLQKTCIVCSV